MRTQLSWEDVLIPQKGHACTNFFSGSESAMIRNLVVEKIFKDEPY